MRKKLLLWATPLFLILTVVLVPHCRYRVMERFHDGPCYRGRPFSYWRERVNDWAEFETAAAWMSPGNALELDRHDPPSREALNRVKDGSWRPRNPFDLDTGRADPALVPLLTHLLQDDERRVRIYAARGLARVGPRAEPAIPALVQVLGSEDVLLTEAAAMALYKIGPSASAAVPALVKLIKDTRRGYQRIGMRRAAAAALETIDPATAATLGELMRPRLRDEDFEEFKRAIGIDKDSD